MNTYKYTSKLFSAGSRDSPLTVHGVLQAKRLGKYLTECGHRFSYMFCSDLQRASKTADFIRQAQSATMSREDAHPVQFISLPSLREQDFGDYEGKAFGSRPRGPADSDKAHFRGPTQDNIAFRDVESKGSVAKRMESFLYNHLVPLIQSQDLGDSISVAIVSHGLALSQLWRSFLQLFPISNVRLTNGTSATEQSRTAVEHIGGWSNTGFLELQIEIVNHETAIAIDRDDRDSTLPQQTKAVSVLKDFEISILTVNGQAHLAGLKRTKGVGSSQHDERQKTIEYFFKRPRFS